MYGGRGKRRVMEMKGIPKKANWLDHMGLTELFANGFRVTQTTEALRRERTRGQQSAERVHERIGRRTRDTMAANGNTMPELLLSEKSIRPALNKRKRARDKALEAGKDLDN